METKETKQKETIREEDVPVPDHEAISKETSTVTVPTRIVAKLFMAVGMEITSVKRRLLSLQAALGGLREMMKDETGAVLEESKDMVAKGEAEIAELLILKEVNITALRELNRAMDESPAIKKWQDETTKFAEANAGKEIEGIGSSFTGTKRNIDEVIARL